MIFISHRGNISGSNPERENTIPYIIEARTAGFDVEVDVWYHNNQWYLGHDEPKHTVNIEGLRNTWMWKHAKNAAALEKLVENQLHPYFWHENDDYTLTSTGIPWIYPGKKMVTGGVVVALGGERGFILPLRFPALHAICSDYVERVRDEVFSQSVGCFAGVGMQDI